MKMRIKACVIAIMALFFTLGCQKDSSDVTPPTISELNMDSNLSVEEARLQYELRRSKARLGANEGIKYKIDWAKGKKQKTPKGVSLLNIPISIEDGTQVEVKLSGSSSKRKLEKDFLRFFATVNKNGSYDFQIAHIIPDENYKAEKGKKVDGKMSGYIIVRDVDDEFIGSYRIEKGKMIGGELKSNSNRGRLSSGPGMCNSTVITYNYYVVILGQSTFKGSRTETRTWCPCDYTYTCYEPWWFYQDIDCLPNPCPPGWYQTETSITFDIEKVNLEPCNERVYDNIINSAMPSTILDIVGNFNQNKEITILLADENLNSATLDGTSTQLNASTHQVTLNTGSLGSASREYIAATIMHEMLHVYLGYETADHQTMATLYVEPMAITLKQLGYYISTESATALAWGGLHVDGNGNTTRAWNELLAQDRVNGTHKVQDIININNQYKTGNVGRSCDGL